jgi:hypothetical protein
MSKKTFSQIRAVLKSLFFISGTFSAFCAFLILSSGCLLAQEPATSLDELKLIVGNGDRVTLMDPSGKSTSGQIEQIAPDAIKLSVGGKSVAFAEKDIRQITRRKQDSVWNGLAIGAGVGFGATLPLYLSLAGRNEKGLAVAASGLWGLIGGGIGAVVDACVTQKQMIYFRPKSKVSWSIRPLYQESQKPAAAVSMPYSQQYGGVDPSKGIAVTVRF